MAVRSDEPTHDHRVDNRALFERRRALLEELAQCGDRSDVTARRHVRLLRRALDDLTAQIVDRNIGLVRSYTRRFTRLASAAEREEFEAAGTLGLMHAVDSYDPESGSFGQWAFKPIQREVLRAVRHRDYSNLSPGDFEKRPAILRARHDLQSVDESYLPSDAEVAAAAGVPVAQVRRVLRPPRVDSIDVVDADGAPAADTIASSEPSTESEVISRQLVSSLRTSGLASLDARELHVVVRRFGLDGAPVETLAEIGATLSVSRETIRLVESKAIAKLQHAVLADADHGGSSLPLVG